MLFVVSLSNYERPFDKLRANGTGQAQGERPFDKLRANGMGAGSG